MKDTVWGGKGRETTYGSPILPNTFSVRSGCSNYSSITDMCPCTCMWYSVVIDDDIHLQCTLHLHFHFHCYQDAPWQF